MGSEMCIRDREKSSYMVPINLIINLKISKSFRKAGRITRRYNQGQIINVKVELTAAHKGFFQYQIAHLVNGQVIGDSQGKLRGYLFTNSEYFIIIS